MKRILTFLLIAAAVFSLAAMPAFADGAVSWDAAFGSNFDKSYDGGAGTVTSVTLSTGNIPNGLSATPSGSGIRVSGIPAVTGDFSFTLTATTDSGSWKLTVNISIASSPKVNVAAKDDIITATVSGFNPANSYYIYYYRNTVNSSVGGTCLNPGGSCPTSAMTNCSISFNGLTAERYYYYCQITVSSVDGGGSYTSNIISVSNPNYAAPTPTPTPSPSPTPKPAPEITKDPTGETVTEGEDAIFIARADNAEKIAWQLVSADGRTTYDCKDAPRYFPGLVIHGADEESLYLDNIPLELNGWSAKAKFTNETGSVTSAPALIVVNKAELPSAVINSSPKSAELDSGESTTLTVSASSPDHNRLKYQWYRNSVASNSNGEIIPGAISESYTPAYAEGTVYYYCVVWNTDGEDTSFAVSSDYAAVSYAAVQQTPAPEAPKETPAPTAAPEKENKTDKPVKKNANTVLIVVCIVGGVAVAGACTTIILLRRSDAEMPPEEEEAPEDGYQGLHDGIHDKEDYEAYFDSIKNENKKQ